MASFEDILEDEINRRYDSLKSWFSINNTGNKLSVVHLNIRSINKYFSEFLLLVNDCNVDIDIITLSEINVSSDQMALYSIDGYNLIYKTRKSREGGGIAIYLKKYLIFKEENEHFMTSEYLVGNIKIAKEELKILLLYRPPNCSISLFITELKHFLQKLKPTDEALIIGDININLLQQSNSNVTLYENILSESGFSKQIQGITREEFRNECLTQSCLDHIYIKSNKNYSSAIIDHKLADHYLIGTFIEMECTNKESKITKKIYQNNNIQKQLKEENWDELLAETCPLNLYSKLVIKFNKIYENNTIMISTSEYSKREACPWITQNLRDMMQHNDTLFNKWKSNPSNYVYRKQYNRWRNSTNKAIHKAKNKYEKNKLLDLRHNAAKMWEHMNKLLGRSKKSIDDIILSNMKDIDERTICEKFANAFSEEVDNIKHLCNNNFLDRDMYVNSQNVSFRYKKVTSSDVSKVIGSLKVKKSPGVDNIRLIDIKSIKTEISPILAHFINLTINNQIYPDLLKISIVRPLFKGGENKSFNNYRPIAILPSINKVVEKTIVNQTSHFLKTFNVINSAQYGFQRGKNTTQLLSKFANDVNNYLNKKMLVAVLFIDFKKAFDTLDHLTLLKSLEESGIRGFMLGWFRNYLTNRAFTVKINSYYSNQKTMRYGVAQGSVTGPMCYIIHVNSLVSVIKRCQKYMFADDTCILYAANDHHTIQTNIQTDFDNITKWSHDNGIILNTNKTKLLCISSNYKRYNKNIKVKGHSYDCLHKNQVCNCNYVEIVKKYKYLGIFLDDSFNWKTQVSSVCNKLRIILSNFKKLRYSTPKYVLYILYHSLVESVVSYGLECYGLTFYTYVNKIKDLQGRFLKNLISKKIAKEEIDNDFLFEKCKLLPIEKKLILGIALSEFWSTEFKNKINNEHMTRRNINNPLYKIPKVNNFYGKRTKEWTVPKIFNSFPSEIKDTAKQLNIVKRKLKNILMSKEFELPI